MNNVFEQNGSWKSLLPDVYDWLGQVKIETTSSPVKGAWHLVAASSAEEGSLDIKVDAPCLPEAFRKKILDTAKSLGWKADSGTLELVVDGDPIILVATPKEKTSHTQKARKFGMEAAKVLKSISMEHLVICDCENFKGLDVFDGLAMGFYELGGFKTGKKAPKARKFPGKISMICKSATPKQIDSYKALAQATTFTRMLQDAPANWLDPVKMAEIAEGMAKECGIKCKILNREEMQKLKMGSLLAVAQGSTKEPRLICLEIDGDDNNKTVSIIGKGLTFDAGGISLKPSAGMGEMKYDMSGGAAVLGAAMFLSKVKPSTKVVAVVGAVENMPAGNAVKPGDICVAMNGKSIEVLNTDAEGRLVLADCLGYVISNYNPEFMIDIATLTGAVLHALGTAGAGLMSNDQDFAKFLLGVSCDIGEPYWQLPLWPELEGEIKSEIADLANIAKPNVSAGTIMGGMFLKEFAGDKKWAHLDIAGTAWNCKTVGYPNAGGSGFGLRMLAEACLRYNR